MTALERLKVVIPKAADGSQDSLLQIYLDYAGNMIRAYKRLDQVPEELETAQEQIAAIYFNRQGMEGEQSRSDGGSSVTIDDLPKSIVMQLDAWQPVRCGPYAWTKRT